MGALWKQFSSASRWPYSPPCPQVRNSYNLSKKLKNYYTSIHTLPFMYLKKNLYYVLKDY